MESSTVDPSKRFDFLRPFERVYYVGLPRGRCLFIISDCFSRRPDFRDTQQSYGVAACEVAPKQVPSIHQPFGSYIDRTTWDVLVAFDGAKQITETNDFGISVANLAKDLLQYVA